MSRTSPSLEQLRILLVDDNKDDFYTTQKQLKQVGEREVLLDWARGYEEALNRSEPYRHDVYLVDFRLGEANGLDLVRELRKRWAQAPMILLSGLRDTNLDAEAIKAGADGFIAKDDHLPVLLERSIRYSLEQKRVEREYVHNQFHLQSIIEQQVKDLVASEERCRQSERLASLGALAAGIAHEIRTPLGTILLTAQNALEQLEEGGDPKELLSESCRRIMGNAGQCAQIIKGILQFARQEETEKVPHDICEVIRSATDIAARALGIGEGYPRLELNGNLPPVLLNPVEMEQVFVNLLQNAVQAGSPWHAITVRTGCLEGMVLVDIEDKGNGIAAESLGNIFDPFFTTKRSCGGTGLGLSIVHGIITAHRGTIEVQSAAGAGTTFTVRLPGAEHRAAC